MTAGGRRYRNWAIYKKSDAYKPGLIHPAAGENKPLPNTPGLRATDWRRNVSTLPQAARTAALVDRRLTSTVRIARYKGATWSQIGAALGITRQGAWARYKQSDRGFRTHRSGAGPDGALGALQYWRERASDLRERTTELVQAARQSGVSWEVIAEQLGVRRQTAWEQFNNCTKDLPL